MSSFDSVFPAGFFESARAHHAALDRFMQHAMSFGRIGDSIMRDSAFGGASHNSPSHSTSRGRFGSAGPCHSVSSSAALVPAGVRTPLDPASDGTGAIARPIRNTLARDGIMPRVTRGGSLDATDVTQPSETVPSHTLRAVPASKQIRGHARSLSSSTVRPWRNATESERKVVSRSSSANIGGSWVRTREGLGRARWDPTHAELKLEGTSTSLFVAIHDEGRNQGICSMPEWSLTCELKCTGAAYLLLFCHYDRLTSSSAASDLSSSTLTATSSVPNSTHLSFLAVCCNTAARTWSLELKRGGSGPSVILGTVRDETLSANRFYHCHILVSRSGGGSTNFTLQVDGHTFFDGITLPIACFDSSDGAGRSSLEGRSIGLGVVRSKAHLRAVRVRETGGSGVTTPVKPRQRSYSTSAAQSPSCSTSSSLARISGHPAGAVSDRTAAVFGSMSDKLADSSHPPPAGPPSPNSSARTSAPRTPDTTTPAPRPSYSSSVSGDDPRLIELIESTIINRDLGVGLDDIASLADAKQLLKESVIMPLLLPDFFQGIRQPSKGILLHGPPGTGKTLLAKAIANVSEVVFFNVNSSVLTSKWRGESEKLVTTLFNMARFYAPAIVFLDEIDALVSERGTAHEHEASRAVKAVMFSQIDGLLSSASPSTGAAGPPKSSPLVMVLATSNCPWDLDQAIRRRLEKRIHIPLPDAAARCDMLRMHMREVTLAEDVDLEELASRTDGFSGADMLVLARDAAMAPFRRFIADKTPSQIRDLTPDALAFTIAQRDFTDALACIKPSVSAEHARRFETWQREFGSAI